MAGSRSYLRNEGALTAPRLAGHSCGGSARPAQGQYRAKAKHSAGQVGREAPWKGSIELLGGPRTRNVAGARYSSAAESRLIERPCKAPFGT